MKNAELFSRLRNFIDITNSQALGLDKNSQGTLLSGYRLSSKEQKSISLVSFSDLNHE
jgi:hypothetical protein